MKAVSQKQKLRTALEDLLSHYVGLVESGDAGNWNPYDEHVVKQAIAALEEGSAIKYGKGSG